MSIAFLVTSPYQLFHYRAIATHMTEVTAVVEHREMDYGLTDEMILRLIPHASIERTSREQFSSLDGRYSAIICQTPILPLEFFEKSFVVAQQYSLAKEAYQYGVWRAHAHLNLMYGPYSVDKVRGFSTAVAVGNPLLDEYFADELPDHTQIKGSRPHILYMPTYGELSSLAAVLPRLKGVDADFTLKLHHAEPRGELTLPDNVSVVHSDTDPGKLFQQHDGVLTDFSGAAFDAVYAGLPVIVTGLADPTAKDYARLSDADLSRSLLRGVATTWTGDDDLLDCFRSAQALVSASERQELVAKLFVNPGTAGAACASAISDLIEHGENADFSVLQVRAATKRYIKLNRQLRVRVARQAQIQPTPAGLSGRALQVRPLYRRIKARLARSQMLRGVVARLRGAQGSRSPATHPQPLQPPHQLREAIWSALAPHLERESVAAARDHGGSGAAAAVLVRDLPNLHRALSTLGQSRSDLQIHVRSDARTTHTVSLRELTLSLLVEAKVLLLGTSAPIDGFPIDLDGYLTVLLVDYDAERNRYLARDGSARRVDWTGLFEHREMSGATAHHAPVVGSTTPHIAEPIDVVYTWVDFDDSAWLEDYSQHSVGHVAYNSSANNPERYVDREELRHSLRSLWLFAPFVRHIYIVTANQRPEWLADHPKVTIVSHHEIFPDNSYLPTFNSHAIEACLHRIPGLSENFLYFNDDVFLGREVDVSTFFTKTGLSKVRLSPSQYIYSGRPEPSAIPTDWAAFNSLQLIERDFNLTFDRRVKHVPLPLKRSVLNEIEEKYPEVIERTRRARFRAITDVAVPSMLAQYYSIATSRAVEWPNIRNEYIYLDTGRANSEERYRAILRRRPAFFCLNVTKYTEIDLASQAKNVREFLSSAFPLPAPWEVPDDRGEDLLP